MLNDFNKLSVVKIITPVTLRAQVNRLLWQPGKYSSDNDAGIVGFFLFFFPFSSPVCKKRGCIGTRQFGLAGGMEINHFNLSRVRRDGRTTGGMNHATCWDARTREKKKIALPRKVPTAAFPRGSCPRLETRRGRDRVHSGETCTYVGRE